MSKLAFIYPGQGAQKCGMGKDFYENSESARKIFDDANEVLDFDVKKMCFEENDELNQTEYTQAAMVTTCLAMTKVLIENGLYPHVTAGLSLGEYAAIASAGGMNSNDAISLVRKRGQIMQNTVPAGEGAMTAVLGMDAEKIAEITNGIDGVSIANYNCPGQIVITGKTEAVSEAGAQLKESGAKRVLPLKVSGPFHSKLLLPGAEELGKELEATSWTSLKIPYVTNVTAKEVSDISETPGLLKEQLTSSVMWMQSMEAMIADGVDTFVEIGPGKTLAGFLRKINRNVTVYSVEKWDDVEKVVEALR